MSQINKKLFKDIMTNNLKGVKQVMSEALLKKDGKSIDTVIEYCGTKLKAKDFRVLDEFYVKNIGDVTDEILRSDHENSNDYQLEFVAINKKTYASVLVTTGLPINYMVLAIYGKYDNGWKVNMLEIGEYSMFDQTAADYYQIATDKYAKGDYIDAGDMMIIASEIAHPAGKFFYYQKEHEMKDTYSIILDGIKANYKFPLAIKDVKTQPMVFHITPKLVVDNGLHGVFPMVRYISQIPIADTVALKAENIAVQGAIGSVFHNIDKNKPCIVYQVFNKMPNDSTSAHYYEFFQRIKYSTRY